MFLKAELFVASLPFYGNTSVSPFVTSAQIVKPMVPSTIITETRKLRVPEISIKQRRIKSPVKYLRWLFCEFS